MSRREWDAEVFVAAWMKYDNVAAVAKSLGVDHKSASVYASRLRRAGVKLPSKRGRNAMDVAKLNSLIDGGEA